MSSEHMIEKRPHAENLPASGESAYARLVFDNPSDAQPKDVLRHTTLIGSAEGCNIQLLGRNVSPAHCIVTLESGILRVRDLRSSTGTRVNGSLVDVCTLAEGDRIGIGTFVLKFETNLFRLFSQVWDEFDTEVSTLPSAFAMNHVSSAGIAVLASDAEVHRIGKYRFPNNSQPYARLVFENDISGGERAQKDVLRSTTLIGGAPGCNIQLVSPKIATAHCVITLESNALRVRDLRTSAGTLVNGSRIEIGTLADGDRLDIGPFAFRVETNLSDKRSSITEPVRSTDVAGSDRQRFLTDLERFAVDRQGLNHAIASLESEIIFVEEEKQKTANAAAQLARDRRQLDEETSLFRAERDRCLQENNELALSKEELKHELEALQIERERLEKDHEQLRRDRETLRSKTNDFSAQKQHLHQDSTTLEAALSELQKNEGRLAKAVAKLDRRRKGFSASRNKRRIELEKLAFKREQLTKDAEKLRADEQINRERTAAFGKESERLHRELHEQQRQLEEKQDAFRSIELRFQKEFEEFSVEREQFIEQELALKFAQNECDRRTAQSVTHAAELERQRQDISHQREQLHVADEALLAETGKLKIDIDRLIEERQCFDEQLASLDSDRHRLEETRTTTSEQSTKIEEQLRELAEREASVSETEINLRTAEEKLQGQFAILNVSRQQLDEEVASLSKLQSEFMQERETSKTKLAEVERKRQQIDREHIQLDVEREELQAQRSRLQSESERFQQMNEDLQRDAGVLTERLRDSNQQESELEKSALRLEKQRCELEERRLLLQNGFADLESGREKFQTEVDESNVERKQIQDALVADRTQIREIQEQTTRVAAELKEETAKLRSQQEQLPTEQAFLQARRKQFEAEVQEFRAEEQRLQERIAAFISYRESIKKQKTHSSLALLEKEAAEILVERGVMESFQAKCLSSVRFRPVQIGRHNVMSLLDIGHTSWIYKARDTETGQTVVLKKLSVEHRADPQIFARFELDARAAGVPGNSNLVSTYECFQNGKDFYLIREFCNAVHLKELTEMHSRLGWRDVCSFAFQTAVGLEQIHKLGLVHLDIRPDKLLVGHDGRLKMLDLGWALLQPDNNCAPSNLQRPDAHAIVDFMAPELIEGDLLDARADIYNLGCTMYFALSGKVPFPNMSISETINAHRALEAPPLQKLAPHVAEPVVRIVEKMMQKIPSKRFQSTEELAQALATFARCRSIQFNFRAILAARRAKAVQRFQYVAKQLRRNRSATVHDETGRADSLIETRL